MSARVAGQVALVVGGARGVGRAQAVRLAQEGADLLLLDSESLAETAHHVETLGRRVFAVEADLSDQRALDAAMADAIGALGRPDIVCITVEHAPADPETAVATLDIPPAIWQSTLDATLTAVWRSCKSAIPHLLQRPGDGGSIVLTAPCPAGRGGDVGAGGHSAVVEHGLIGLTCTLAVELAPHRVRINVVVPSARASTDVPDHAGIADVSLFLASDQSRHLTGVAMSVPANPYPQ